MRIDVWSDIVCPWYAIGKKRLASALARFEHADEVQVVWHAFELDPTPQAQRPHFDSIAELLAKKYGMPLEQAKAANARVTAAAADEGMHWNTDAIQPSATFDAHRLLAFAATQDRQAGEHVQAALMDRLMTAYFAEGQLISQHATLQAAGEAVGLAAADVADLLASDAFTDEVRADERMAAQSGITGVPFFVLGGRYAVSGAQPVELLLGGLRQAWADPEARGA